MVAAPTGVLDNKTATVSRLAARDTMAFMVFLLRTISACPRGKERTPYFYQTCLRLAIDRAMGLPRAVHMGGLKLYPCALLIWSRYEQSPAAVVCVWCAGASGFSGSDCRSELEACQDAGTCI